MVVAGVLVIGNELHTGLMKVTNHDITLHITRFNLERDNKVTIELHNIDCMEYMKTCKDNEFDLAIVDPPYFSGPETGKYYRNGGLSKSGVAAGVYKKINKWDVPGEDYFKEIERVSKNQIIWGVNYYAKHIESTGRIFWDKDNTGSSFSDGELASCSMIKSVRIFKYRWNGMIQADMKNKEQRIHPTQKPIALYKWLLMKYAKPGQNIIDTHLGSGSIAIACHYFGVDLVGCELDKDCFKSAKARIHQCTQQMDMF